MWRDYDYMGLETCAADGMCATACPVGIDTGRLVKHFRRRRHSRAVDGLGRHVAAHLGIVESMVRGGLAAGHAVSRVFGAGAVSAMTRAARRVVGRRLPLWTHEMPLPAARLPATSRAGAAAVYLPACVSRVFGASPADGSQLSLQQALVVVAGRAGAPVWIPGDVRGTCCGTPFSSKGLASGHREAANAAIERCWTWSDEGRLPIVVDANSCTHGLRDCADVLSAANRTKLAGLRIVDAVEFARRELLPHLAVRRRASSVAVHPTCSLVHLGLVEDLTALASACAEQALVPAHAACCGFAGDRGFLVPELTASATRREAADVRAAPCDDHVSSNRMCEVALTSATGRPYRSIIQLLEQATRPV
jgi:D-lactate dehydrogenase